MDRLYQGSELCIVSFVVIGTRNKRENLYVHWKSPYFRNGNALYNGKAWSKSLMLTSGLFKSFIKQVLKMYKLRNNLNSINSH